MLHRLKLCITSYIIKPRLTQILAKDSYFWNKGKKYSRNPKNSNFFCL